VVTTGDEMIPSIEAAKKLAKILDTTVGYLLGETDQADLFKDPKMLQRFQDIANFRFLIILIFKNFTFCYK